MKNDTIKIKKINFKTFEIILFFILTCLYQIAFYDYGMNMLDGGLLLNGALRTLNGEIAVIDFFGYPPGQYMYVAFFFKLLGISIHSVRIGMMILTSFSVIIILLLSKKLIKSRVYLAPPILYMLAPTCYNARFLAFLTVLCMLLTFKFIENRKIINLIVLSFISALTIYFRQDISGFALSTAFFIVIFQNLYSQNSTSKKSLQSIVKELLILVFVFICVILPILIYIFNHPEFYTELKSYFKAIKNFNNKIKITNLPNLFEYFTNKNVGTKTLFESALFYFPFLVYIVLTIKLIIDYKSKKHINGCLLAVLIFGIQSTTYTISYPDIWHTLVIYPLVFLASAFLLNVICNTFKRYSNDKIKDTVIELSLLSILIIPFAAITIFNYGFLFGSIGVLNRDHTFLDIERAKIYIPSEQFETINKILQFVNNQSAKDDKIFVMPYEVIWYFLSKRENPTRYDYLLPGSLDKDAQERIISSLKNNPPKIVIYQDTSLDGREETKIKYFATLLDNYIKKNYKPVKVIESYTLMMNPG